MTQSQNIHGDVGQAIQTESMTQIHHHHDHGRPLTQQERSELNNKVIRLDEEFNEPGWKTWGFLHRTIGTEKIEQMRLGHRDIAHTILDLLIERAEGSHTADLDRASEITSLISRNSELTAKAKKLQSDATTLNRCLADERARSASLTERLNEAVGRLGHSDALRSDAVDRYRLANESEQEAADHAKRLTAGLITSILVAVIAAVGAAYQTTQLQKAEEILRTCPIDGRTYRLGYIANNAQSGQKWQCVWQGSFASWQAIEPVVAKQKRSKKP